MRDPIAGLIERPVARQAADLKRQTLRHFRISIRPGQTVLVLGASSGVGIAAIQIAKLFRATVITTAGDQSKLEKARALGADYLIDHYQQKISEEVRKITNKQGVDIVIEHVGPATWDESVKSLKPAGTLVTCGATTGPSVGIDLRINQVVNRPMVGVRAVLPKYLLGRSP